MATILRNRHRPNERRFWFSRRTAKPAELLDWLAVHFVEKAGTFKKFVKLILTSHAYRQSSKVIRRDIERDPDNRLLARAPRLRLDAEVLRDQALLVSGLLVETSAANRSSHISRQTSGNRLDSATATRDITNKTRATRCIGAACTHS